jgi:hypothetical protein
MELENEGKMEGLESDGESGVYSAGGDKIPPTRFFPFHHIELVLPPSPTPVTLAKMHFFFIGGA